MAIEIAPVKKESFNKESVALLFSILILAASFGLYFYLSKVLLAQKEQETINLNSQLSSLGQEDIKTKEAELALAGVYINDFKILFENNPKASNFFGTFQKWAHPKVVYAGFNFDTTGKISMAGTTSGFQNVMQQLALLKKEETIESYQISNVAMTETGGVTFNLSLVLKPEVLK
jgi:hypothetical protein